MHCWAPAIAHARLLSPHFCTCPHCPPQQSEVSYEFVSDSFAVIASRSYASGEQVFVNYGQANDGLMQYYGFSEVRMRLGGG